MAIESWTGRHAVALQRALRLSNGQFAAMLGMSLRAVASWHQHPERVLATLTQQVLDTALSRADAEARVRFDATLAPTAQGAAIVAPPVSGPTLDRSREVLLAALRRGTASRDSDVPDLFAAVAELQDDVEDYLADGSNRRTRLERLEEGITHHGRDALVVPPIEMICRASLDLTDARHLRQISPSEADHAAIRRCVARLAAIVADEMSVLGNVSAARSWYSTAIAAADASEDDALRADVRALAAMLPLYHGLPEGVISLATKANELAHGNSTFAAGLAPMLAGLAWARVGNAVRARDSLNLARVAHDRSEPTTQIESVFGFSTRRRLFYESRLLTLIGDHLSANQIRAEALTLYPAHVVGDPALMVLDQAASLVSTGEYEAGAVLAADTVHGLPPAQRGRMFLDAARRVIDTVPRAYRNLPEVEMSRDAITELE